MQKSRPLRFARRIIAAICKKRLVCLTYGGEERWVAPYIYGMGVSGKMLLNAFQVKNSAHPDVPPAWRTFEEGGISRMKVLRETFKRRYDYRADNPLFGAVVCSIEPLKKVTHVRPRPDSHPRDLLQ